MRFCNICGGIVEDWEDKCPYCGTHLGKAADTFTPTNDVQTSPAPSVDLPLTPLVGKTNNTTVPITAGEKILAAVSYFGILWTMPLVAGRNSKFVRYHAKCGITLFCLQIVTILVAVGLFHGFVATLSTNEYTEVGDEVVWIILAGAFVGFLLFAVLPLIGVICALMGKYKSVFPWKPTNNLDASPAKPKVPEHEPSEQLDLKELIPHYGLWQVFKRDPKMYKSVKILAILAAVVFGGIILVLRIVSLCT